MSLADIHRATGPGALVHRLDDRNAAAAFDAIANRLAGVSNRSDEILDQPPVTAHVRHDGRRRTAVRVGVYIRHEPLDGSTKIG